MQVNLLGVYLWTLVAIAAGCFYGLTGVGVVAALQVVLYILVELVTPITKVVIEHIQERRRRNR